MSIIQRASTTELDLNNEQITACRKHAGAARWAYNWGVARTQESYRKTGKSPSAVDLHRELNALKTTDVPWMYAVSKCAPQEALRNWDAAVAHFFRRCHLKKEGKLRGKLRGKMGDPKRKTKKRGLGGFRLTGSLSVFPDARQVPRLGRLRLNERDYLPSTAKILAATVSEQAGHWCVSVLSEQEQDIPENTGPVVGVDLGVKSLATRSDGVVIATPRHLKHTRTRLTRCQRTVSRRQNGSQNRKKRMRHLANWHRKIANQRANTRHHVTTNLAKTKSVIVIEDLQVAGMLRNHHLAQALADVGFAEFKQQLLYKATWYGSKVVLADRWEPSSKRCSGCGHIKEALLLSERSYRCDVCGLVVDRDRNAALTLRKLADSSSESHNAGGEGSAGLCRTALVKLPPMKHEPATFDASA